MNIIYETTKERGTTILIPTSMVDSLNPASALVLAGPLSIGWPLPVSTPRGYGGFCHADSGQNYGAEIAERVIRAATLSFTASSPTMAGGSR
jgi:hypothetical protein